jgi:hypothetical protein
VSRSILDAGALIALERNDRTVWAALKLAALNGEDVVVPTTVLAQVWRGRASQALLAQALQHCVLESFDNGLLRTRAPPNPGTFFRQLGGRADGLLRTRVRFSGTSRRCVQTSLTRVRFSGNCAGGRTIPGV